MLTCKRSLVAVLLLGAVALAGCGGSSSGQGDAGGGAGSGGRGGTSGSGGAGARDAGAEGGPTDLRADTATDARSDGGDTAAPSDARSESPPDLRADAGLDVPVDGNVDTAVPGDSGTDIPVAGDGSAPADAGAPGDAAVPPESYLAALTGAEEVPPFDTAARGSATLSYDPASHILYWTLSHTVTGATSVHIHTAAAGGNGDAIFLLDTAASTTGSATLDSVLETDLRLGRLYLDVHSAVAPAGEIRGQILRPGETLWIARLTGAEEVPPTPSTGTGTMSLIVNSAQTSAHYRLVTSLTPTIGHLHIGVAGVAGTPITALLFVGSTSEADLPISGEMFSALDQTQVYANIHTAAFNGTINGEIRGQLLRAGSRLYVSKMTGANEVPPVASAGTGNASVAVDYRSTTVRYAVTTSLSPTAAHIHPGIAGVVNTSILTLTNPSASFAGAGTLTQAQIDALAAGRLYTDLHTTASPDGEIRGQLLRPGEQLFAAALSGSNEVPPVTSAATGTTQLILNAAGTLLRYESAVSGLDATSAFLVNGPAGVAGGSLVATLTVVGSNPIGTLAVTATDASNLAASRYYIDIHSNLHPEGEIRGQVAPR